ncbi:MAG: putative toxin-antitoxin system toxin component, PIN family [Synergistaceae bacterium]|jgi:putative PIN family toxin of toxin-antitoxin system|nr:putative toxin-antitoxin system toxin component, PIN family [Synergistaceae bacterium]
MTQPVVLDTNILVSALLTPDGNSAQILGMVLKGRLQIGYDSRIMAEYHNVLARPKFHFDLQKTDRLLDILLGKGLSVIAERSDIVFYDETDRKFYEVALELNACLITGNLKHYPQAAFIKTPSEYLKSLALKTTAAIHSAP